jgi:putative DNA primase/helicase
MNLEEVAGRFPNARRSGAGYSVRCPLHDDKNASASVNDGDIGVQVHCFVCGKERTAEVIAAVGLTFKDLMYSSNGNGHRAVVTSYPYHDENGTPLYYIKRTQPKGFFAEKPDGTKSIKGARRVLYRLPELLAADVETVVYLCEGEKDADRLASLGLLATTTTFGSKAPWLDEYGEVLRGRHIVIPRDHDEPGVAYAEDRARHLHGIAASVKIVHLYDGPIPPKHGKDISDWLNEGHDVEELVRLEEAAPEWTPETKTVEPETGLQPHIDSGVANMERLVHQHHQDVRHLDRVGWYAWDGRRFARDAEAELVRRAIATVRTMYHEAADIEDEKERVSFLNHIRRSESEPEIRRMVTLAQSHVDVHVPKPERFDRDRMLFNVENGTIDLRTGELHPHRRDDLITKLAGCAYDPNAKCPTFDAFLERIFDGSLEMRGFVRRLIGYCLTGEVREHVLPIFWGDGANGKTTFFLTMLALFGEYGTTAPPDLLVVRKHKGHPTELMCLMGARFAAATETPQGAFLSETVVKTITGGDRIKARGVFENFVEFPPTHKILMATNHKPAVVGCDAGIWRRLLLVPFDVTIEPDEQDVHMVDKLLLELPGVLNWALEGCRQWQKGGLKPPEAVRVATKAYREESDHLPAFLDECCVLAPHAKVEKGKFFADYTAWCQRNAETSMPKVELGRRLKAKGIEDVKSDKHRFWKGIGLVVKDTTS